MPAPSCRNSEARARTFDYQLIASANCLEICDKITQQAVNIGEPFFSITQILGRELPKAARGSPDPLFSGILARSRASASSAAL